ncbi:hypothetical protein ACFPIJ_33750 [Dactylosporangium cerinum]|uniref:Knr4/Smi1-like domain-containing protein n=1 Tax=Dactylosporangium cerinum TaxID=1434730 RepID=A0ABV9W4K8_9ACTN
MDQGLDMARVLGGLETRVDAWRFVRAFAADWAAPVTDADGFADEALDVAEAALGVCMPAAVRDAYRLFGRRRDLTSGNGDLYSPDQLRYDAAADVLVFRAAHQAVAFFGVSLADKAAPDPQVLLYTTYQDKTQESWQPFLDRFSLACVDMVLWEMVEAGPHSDARDETNDDQAALADDLTAVPFPRYPDEFGSQWYVSADIILRHDPGWIAVAARTPEALDAFRHSHPGGWVNE